MRSGLYHGQVVHHRSRPRVHRLRMRIFSVLIDLDEIDALNARLRWFSRGRFNLFSFHDRDHGDGSATPLRDQAETLLSAAGLGHGGRILLLTMPRMLGFAFNPLSVWFCHDRAGRMSAIIYEVNNTFGERHRYVLPARPDARGSVRQSSPKRFHVSPFLPMAMTYAFRVHSHDDRLIVAITASDAGGAVLNAVHHATRRDLTDGALIAALFTHPLMTVKVVGGIGWEAFRLWLKRVPVHDHPGAPASHGVTFAPPATETLCN